LSWWKRGHELGEHAPAGVEYTASVPARVRDTTALCALPSVSSVPKEPSSGVATVQSMAVAAVRQAIEARVGDVTARVVGVAVADAAGFVASVLAVLDDPTRAPGIRCTTPDLAGLPKAVPTGDLDRAHPRDVALIVYTSGTTGRPKGAPLTHANLLAGAHAVRIAWRWTAEDRLALCLPLFHMHGLGVGLHGTLTAGAEALVLPKFEPAAVAEAIRGHRATLFFGVPTMYHRLAGSPHLDNLRALRLAVSGSAPYAGAVGRSTASATLTTWIARA